MKLPRATLKQPKPATDIGPGGYDIKDQMEGGYSFGKAKTVEGKDAAAPGPGAYKPKDVSKLSNLGRFGKQVRGIDKVRATTSDAGPGAYDLKDKWGGGYSFGKDKK